MTLNNKIKNSILSSLQTEELDAIQNWKNQLSNNIDELSDHLETAEVTNELKGYKSVDTAGAWDKVSNRIPEMSTPSNVKELKPKLNGMVWKIAAAMVFVVGAFIAFQYVSQGPKVYKSQMVEAKLMKDGSTITLDEGTQLTQVDDRNYQLKGRAYFKVAKDATHPFTVQTNHGLLTVLGTQFNIYTTDNWTHVAVTEGKVKFVNLGKEYILTDGDIILSSKDQTFVMHADKMMYDSWKDKSLKFKDDNLHYVLENVATYYKVSIVFADNSEFDACKINSTFKEETLAEVLKELKVLVGLDYDFDGQTISAKAFNCN